MRGSAEGVLNRTNVHTPAPTQLSGGAPTARLRTTIGDTASAAPQTSAAAGRNIARGDARNFSHTSPRQPARKMLNVDWHAIATPTAAPVAPQRRHESPARAHSRATTTAAA